MSQNLWPGVWNQVFYRLRLKSWFLSAVCFVNALPWFWCQSVGESSLLSPFFTIKKKEKRKNPHTLQIHSSHSFFPLNMNILLKYKEGKKSYINLILCSMAHVSPLSFSIKQPIICWSNWLCFSSSDVTDSKMNLMRTCVRKCGSVCWCHSSSCAVWSQSPFGCWHNRNAQIKRCTNLTETWALSVFAACSWVYDASFGYFITGMLNVKKFGSKSDLKKKRNEIFYSWRMHYTYQKYQ